MQNRKDIEDPELQLTPATRIPHHNNQENCWGAWSNTNRRQLWGLKTSIQPYLSKFSVFIRCGRKLDTFALSATHHFIKDSLRGTTP
jgi:hypothetical protein